MHVCRGRPSGHGLLTFPHRLRLHRSIAVRHYVLTPPLAAVFLLVLGTFSSLGTGFCIFSFGLIQSFIMAGPVVDHDSRRTRASFADTSANTNQVMPIPSLSVPEAYQTALEATSCGIDFSPLETSYTWKGLDSIAALGLSLGAEEDNEPPVAAVDFSYAAHQDYHGDDHGLGLFGDASKPFHRWIKTLQRRAQRPRHRRSRGCSAHAREAFPGFLQDSFSPPGHRKSSSDSSFGYVAAVRSASVSVAGSVLTRSRRNTIRSSYHARTDRGSRASTSGARLSEDSTCYERPLPLDPAVKERLLQRRRVIEELISTEESYIGDLKFLMNVSNPRQPLNSTN